MRRHAFSLPLSRPFFWNGQELRTREGEIWVEGAAMVEWAPFPGLHDCLESYRRYLLSELDFWRERGPIKAKDISFHGLVTPQEKNWDYLEKFSVIKVKCARQSLELDMEFFQFLCRKFPRARFRLDANGLWSEEDLEQFSRAVDEGRIDYFEEPSPHCRELMGKFPIALDEEVIRCLKKGEWQSLQGARALVVKPHLYSSIQQVFQLVEWAKSHGVPVVLSSLFNSSVGTQNLLRLAALWGDGVVHGLDPYFYLAKDTVKNPLVATGDCFAAGEASKTLELLW